MSGETQFQTSRLMLTTAILLFCTVAVVFLLSSVKKTQLAAAIPSQHDSSSENPSWIGDSAAVSRSQPRSGDGRMDALVSSDFDASRNDHHAGAAESAIRPASARIVDGANSSAHQAWNQTVASGNVDPNSAFPNHSSGRMDHDHQLRSEIALLRRTIEQFVAAEATAAGPTVAGSSAGNSMGPTSSLTDIQLRISQLDQAIDNLRQENRLTRELMIAHKELTSHSIAQLKDVQPAGATTAKVPDGTASTITLNIITNDSARVQQVDTPVAHSSTATATAATGAGASGQAASGSMAAEKSRSTADLPLRFAERSMAGHVSDAAPGFLSGADSQTVASAPSGNDLHDALPDSATEYSTLVIQPRGQTPKIYQHYSVPDDTAGLESTLQDHGNMRSGSTRSDGVSSAPQPVPFSIPQTQSKETNGLDAGDSAVPSPVDRSVAPEPAASIQSQQIPDVPEAFLKSTPLSEQPVEMPAQVDQILPGRPESSPFGEPQRESDGFEQQQLFPELPAQTSTRQTHMRQASAQQASAQQASAQRSSLQQSPVQQSRVQQGRAQMAVDRLAQSRQAALSAPAPEQRLAPEQRPAAVPEIPSRQQVAEAIRNRQQTAGLPTAISEKARTPTRVSSHPGIDMTVSASAHSAATRNSDPVIKPDAPHQISTVSPYATTASDRNQRIKQAAFDAANHSPGPSGQSPSQSPGQTVPVRFEHTYRFSSSSDAMPAEHRAQASRQKAIEPPPVPPVPSADVSVRPVPVSAASALAQSRPSAIPIGAASGLTQSVEYSAPRQVPPVPKIVPAQRSMPSRHPVLSQTSAAAPEASATPASFIDPPVTATTNSVATEATAAPVFDSAVGREGAQRKRSWLPDFDAPRLPQINLPDVRDIERPEWLQGRQMPNPIKSIRESRAANRISSMFKMPGRQKTVD